MVQHLSSVLESLGSSSRVAKGNREAVTEADSCDFSRHWFTGVCDHDEDIISTSAVIVLGLICTS